ncbi:pyrroline-5-carboxylate reductase [Jeotgalibaca sp. MA1X17-3]|uniref:pyrroline-5-carboxylate reductase n=1 Tax=Jeotgalibaca sp. MA1X17-3 TaxID=2908211 RepID=UPI001F2F235E|nr:pyrroline-5-carboxylate reductase [Jeotgalibaca sp. MA1X17-3]UJF14617.1 pyrroline-5-carboxylate reductase [Jeotgalibaca sp. MA1X17-3]
MIKVGFIGIGNMGSAMANGLVQANDIDVYVYDIDEKKKAKMDKNKVKILESVKEIFDHSKYVILAVKPDVYKLIFKEIKPYITNEHIIVTIAPGFSIHSIKGFLGQSTNVVRTMPNTPALVREGMTAYSFEEGEITEEDHEEVKKIFSSFGKYIKINEKDIEAFIAIAGSSPAYAYVYMEAMADAAVSFGLARDVSYQLAAQALKGAAQMVLESGEHPGVLKDAVTSPGGGTIQAILKLEETGFRSSIIQSMRAVYEKSIEQGKLSE